MLRLTVIAAAAVYLSGCAAAQYAQMAYGDVRAGYGAAAAYHSVKDIRDAQPIFAGYGSVVAYAQLTPHDAQLADAIKSAFADSLRYQVDSYAKSLPVPVASCAAISQCPGKVLSIQFTEDAYGANLAEKIAVGDKLKGRLSFVDLASGQIVAEKRIEGVSTYSDVLGIARGTILFSLLKSYPQAKADIDKLNAIPAVKPGYEKLLSTT